MAHLGLSTPKKKPPYAKNLRPRRNECRVIIGSREGWGRIRREQDSGFFHSLLLPPGVQPSDFDWSAVDGISVLVIELEETSLELRHALVLLLARAGAIEICLIPASRKNSDYVWYPPNLLKGRATA